MPEQIWLEPHKLNSRSKFYNSQFLPIDADNITYYNEYEKVYGKEPWFRAMVQRMKSKTAQQIDLDRQLVEAIGRGFVTNGIEPESNLELVKTLIEKGRVVRLLTFVKKWDIIFNVNILILLVFHTLC